MDMICYWIFYLIVCLVSGSQIALESDENDPEVADGVQVAIEVIAAQIQASYKSILQSSRLFSDDFEKRVHESFDLAKEELVELSSLLFDKLETLQYDQGITIDCVGAHGRALKAVLKNGEKEVEICFEGTISTSNEIFSMASKGFGGVKHNLVALRNITTGCRKMCESTVTFVACVISKSSEVQANVTELFANIRDFMIANMMKTVDILGENAKCNENAYLATKTQLLSSASDIEKCFSLNNAAPIPGLHHFNSAEFAN